MYSSATGYKSVQNFAKTYLNKQGKPTTRQYIYELIDRERTAPDTTAIDVIQLDGKHFVKLRDLATPFKRTKRTRQTNRIEPPVPAKIPAPAHQPVASKPKVKYTVL
ncbi:MAG: hypothetical protein WKF87_06570 [Chryseolinea sp.]